MKTSITKGMNEQDKSELTAEFKHCYRLRARLVEMLEGQISNIHDNMLNEVVGNNDSWALSQAEKIAEVRATKKLISLLSN